MLNKKRLSFCALVMATVMLFSACSSAVDETTVAELTTTTSMEETTPTGGDCDVTETTEEEEQEIIWSTAVVTERVVDNNGQLQVIGTNLCNEAGEPIQLKGMSTYGLNSMVNFVNVDTVQTLAEDWGCSVFRLAMYTYSDIRAYNTNPDEYYEQMREYIQLCIDQGIYVICDWHILYDGDPNEYKDDAIYFFERISAEFGDCPNLIYEICNEPNGPCIDDPSQEVGWENCIKPYAEDVIATIRANDPDNIIIVGTPHWSSDVDIVSEDPLDGENLMYAFHFYAGSSGQEKRDRIQVAIDNGLPVFCSEWGVSQDSGTGGVAYESTLEWIEFMDENNISWCNWSIGGAHNESSNALKLFTDLLDPNQKIHGHWPDFFLTRSGLFVRALILGQEFEIPED